MFGEKEITRMFDVCNLHKAATLRMKIDEFVEDAILTDRDREDLFSILEAAVKDNRPEIAKRELYWCDTHVRESFVEAAEGILYTK